MAEAAKKKKKKLLRVKAYPGSNSSGYSNSSMIFSLANIIDGERQQVLPGYTCREQLCGAIKNGVQGSLSNGFTMDFERTRLLIVQDPSNFSDFRDKLFTGKMLANTFEREAGWEPLSKITTVKHGSYKNAWLLTGPGEWMSQPQLMSTLTLLLRLASKHGPFEASTIDETEAVMKKLVKNRSSSGGDIGYFLPHVWDSLRLVTVHHKEIFGNMTPKQAWNDPSGSSFGYASGILNFVQSEITYSKEAIAAQRRFKELRQKK